MNARLTVTIPRDRWLTANRTITNHGYRRAIITAIHELADTSARAQRLPAIDTPCIVTWTIHYPHGTGNADPVNSHPSTKAVMDALVPKWLPADDSRHVVEERFRRGANLPEKGAHLIVATFETAGTSGWNGRIGGISEGPRIAAETPLTTQSTVRRTNVVGSKGTPVARGGVH